MAPVMAAPARTRSYRVRTEGPACISGGRRQSAGRSHSGSCRSWPPPHPPPRGQQTVLKTPLMLRHCRAQRGRIQPPPRAVLRHSLRPCIGHVVCSHKRDRDAVVQCPLVPALTASRRAPRLRLPPELGGCWPGFGRASHGSADTGRPACRPGYSGTRSKITSQGARWRRVSAVLPQPGWPCSRREAMPVTMRSAR